MRNITQLLIAGYLLAVSVIPVLATEEKHCAETLMYMPLDLPSPRYRVGLGTSDLPIASKIPEAQRFFNLGLNLLHSFWDFEAIRAFREASRLDPEASMPYWGILMSLPYAGEYEFSELREEAINKVKAGIPKAGAQEKGYLEAALLYTQGETTAYFERWREHIRQFPNDVDAVGLLAYHLLDGYQDDGRPRKRQKEAEKWLSDYLPRFPAHTALLHYYIHAMELSPQPERALPQAEKLQELAPMSPHLLHMPGHLYYLLGRYEEALDAFRQSQEVDLRYLREEGVHPIDSWNYLHNLHYMVASFSEKGQYREAQRHAEMLATIELPKDRPTVAERFRLGYELWLAPTEVAWRFARFKDAIELLKPRQAQAAEISPALVIFYGGIEGCLQARLTLQEEAGVAKELATLNKAIKSLQSYQASPLELRYLRSATSVLEICQSEISAMAAKTWNEAQQHFLEAKRLEASLRHREPPRYSTPVAETMALAAWRHGEHEVARREFQEALAKRKRSGQVLSKQLRFLEDIGDKNAAADTRSILGAAWQNADPEYRIP